MIKYEGRIPYNGSYVLFEVAFEKPYRIHVLDLHGPVSVTNAFEKICSYVVAQLVDQEHAGNPHIEDYEFIGYHTDGVTSRFDPGTGQFAPAGPEVRYVPFMLKMADLLMDQNEKWLKEFRPRGVKSDA